MAVLTRAQLDYIRLLLEDSTQSGISTGAVSKVVWNAAVQSVEDWFENTARGEISAVINTATSPTVLTTAQKTAIAKYWLLSKFNRGG